VCQPLYGYIKLFFGKYGPQSVLILNNKSITKNDKNLINTKAPELSGAFVFIYNFVYIILYLHQRCKTNRHESLRA
jgi:hypothetical protein